MQLKEMLITAMPLGSGIHARVVTGAHGGVVTRGQVASRGVRQQSMEGLR